MRRLEDVLTESFSAIGISCTDRQLEQFRQYYALLEERNRQMNLTAITGEEEVALLHFVDSATILPHLPGNARRILDVGSGAGFPGLVLRILRPDLELTLIDSQQKRVLFQQDVCSFLGLEGVHCLHLRAEEAPLSMREAFDVVTSRDVARLNVLSELCMPFVAVNGSFFAMKGAAAQEELSESTHALSLLGGDAPRLIPCPIPGKDAEHALVVCSKRKATPARYPRRFAQIRKQPLQ